MKEEFAKVWGIHTQNDLLFLDESVIAIGWEELGDLTKADKTKAIKMYSKTNHINFLINDYYEHIFSNKDKKNKIWADIESILDYYHIEECCGKYFYNTLTIKHYNNLRQNITTK